MNIGRLEGFYWVARTGGYARAARAFPYPITQPGVHQQVRKLEDELGVRLFERVAKDKVRLTTQGQVLFDFVRSFFEGLPEAVRASKGGQIGGTLRVEAAGLAMRALLPAWLARVRKARPEIKVELKEVRTLDFEALRHGELDMLIDYIPNPPPFVVKHVVGRFRPYLVLPQGHALAKKRSLGLADLAGEPFVGYPAGTLQRTLQEEALRKHGVTAQVQFAVNSAETILALVGAGLGYSLVPWLSSTELKARGVTARPFDAEKSVELPLSAAVRQPAGPTPLIDAFLSLCPGGAVSAR